jgi:hypothetical protein
MCKILRTNSFIVTQNPVLFPPSSASLPLPERLMSPLESRSAFDERRSNDPGPGFGSYTKGIERVELLVTEDLKVHDLECHHDSDPDWQNDYSLLLHSLTLSRVMRKVSTTLGRAAQITEVGGVAALFHDTGKLDPTCHIYRLNRKLNPEEYQAISRHADISGRYVLRRMADVRAEDRAFLSDVHWIVRYHHTPWNIRDPLLRQLGYDLKYSDAFLSKTENRHRPGMSQWQAVEWLQKFAHEEKRDTRQTECHSEISASAGILERIYGANVHL